METLLRSDDPSLDIIREAIERLIPGAAPAFLTVQLTEKHPARTAVRTWTDTPAGLAERIHTGLFGRLRTQAQSSPLAQADEAKGRRDVGAMVEVLTHADHQLTHAPWYPCRPGDLVHVHYEATSLVPAFGETYVVGNASGPGDAPDGLMSMQLLAHTFEGGDPDEFGVGCAAVEAADCPVYGLWFEGGPHRLTIVRDGRVVHNGRAR